MLNRKKVLANQNSLKTDQLISNFKKLKTTGKSKHGLIDNFEEFNNSLFNPKKKMLISAIQVLVDDLSEEFYEEIEELSGSKRFFAEQEKEEWLYAEDQASRKFISILRNSPIFKNAKFPTAKEWKSLIAKMAKEESEVVSLEAFFSKLFSRVLDRKFALTNSKQIFGTDVHKYS